VGRAVNSLVNICWLVVPCKCRGAREAPGKYQPLEQLRAQGLSPRNFFLLHDRVCAKRMCGSITNVGEYESKGDERENVRRHSPMAFRRIRTRFLPVLRHCLSRIIAKANFAERSCEKISRARACAAAAKGKSRWSSLLVLASTPRRGHQVPPPAPYSTSYSAAKPCQRLYYNRLHLLILSLSSLALTPP
jgi:hypothetical protein